MFYRICLCACVCVCERDGYHPCVSQRNMQVWKCNNGVVKMHTAHLDVCVCVHEKWLIAQFSFLLLQCQWTLLRVCVHLPGLLQRVFVCFFFVSEFVCVCLCVCVESWLTCPGSLIIPYQSNPCSSHITNNECISISFIFAVVSSLYY